jgi:hypothetical protein
MFDFRSALAANAGNELDFDQLEELLRRIKQEHLADISPEIGVRELLALAQENNWITEDENGRFHIQVPVAA